MCECTPKAPGRYCGLPGCRSPQEIEQEYINREAEELARRRSEAGYVEHQQGPADEFGDVA